MAETTFIDGEIFFDIKRDQAKRDEMAKERAALEAADRGRAPWFLKEMTMTHTLVIPRERSDRGIAVDAYLQISLRSG